MAVCELMAIVVFLAHSFVSNIFFLLKVNIQDPCISPLSPPILLFIYLADSTIIPHAWLHFPFIKLLGLSNANCIPMLLLKSLADSSNSFRWRQVDILFRFDSISLLAASVLDGITTG